MNAHLPPPAAVAQPQWERIQRMCGTYDDLRFALLCVDEMLTAHFQDDARAAADEAAKALYALADQVYLYEGSSE